MTAERGARMIVLGLLLGVPLSVVALMWTVPVHATEVHGRMAEAGGWMPANLTARVGEPLQLRLTSDDVVHGFAVGQTDWPEIEVQPGQVTTANLTFDQPGTYTFYCSRWCGPNHWRMRGVIDVTGPGAPKSATSPLYLSLGLDLDAPHPAGQVPDEPPAAARGAASGVSIPPEFLTTEYYRAHSPAEAWLALRAQPSTSTATDAEVWNLVAYVWQRRATPQSLAEGARLYAANCAACHGETGQGDGVMAAALGSPALDEKGHTLLPPAAFTTADSILGASPALLQGKIIRGGMGTGMPYWGPIFTNAQTWALVAFLYTFQMA